MLTVRRNYVRSGDRVIEKTTKTHQMRRIALDAATVEVLAAHRQRYDEVARQLGIEPRDAAYVFSYQPAHDVRYTAWRAIGEAWFEAQQQLSG